MENKKKQMGGLGRGLSDLLDDNDGIPNMKSNVLLRREDGERVKIYDKTGGEEKRSSASVKVIKR
jgi:hypothetical protein